MIQKFATYLRAVRGYSENTIRAYSADLQSYARWARENNEGARWSTTTREDIDKYLEHCKQLRLSASSTNRQLAAISGLYRFMQRNGLDVENPCKYESRKKQAQTLPTTINPKQLCKAYNRAHGIGKVMLGLLITTGIRIQELLDLTYEDIDFDNCTLRIMGKGSKERIVKTEPESLKTLHGLVTDLKASGRIFYISQRKARSMVYDMLQPYCKGAALNPHAIRHTFATELAKAGESTTTIAKMLGHAHIETSQKYINMAEIPTTHKGISLTQNATT